MTTKQFLRWIAIIGILAGSIASPPQAAHAWSGSCGDYVTAAAGDTVESIATTCGISADAIRAANPGVSSQLAAGQVIFVPGGAPASPLVLTYVTPGYVPPVGGNNTYVVQPGDTLGGIAFRFGVPFSSLLAVNPQIANPSVIYVGQVINLPRSIRVTPVPSPVPPLSSGFAGLKVTYGHGLLVRTGPGKNFPEIVSPLVGALKDEVFRYRKNSITFDSSGLVWVEIQLNPASGFAAGWIMTRDALGQYFTRPAIGPRIDRRDP